MSRRRAAGAGTHALARFVTKHSSMRRREVVWRRQTCLSLARSALWARRRRSIGRGGRVYGAASCGFASPSRQSRKVKSAALAAAIEYKPLSQKKVLFFLHFLTGPSELQTCQKLHFYSPCCLLFLMWDWTNNPSTPQKKKKKFSSLPCWIFWFWVCWHGWPSERFADLQTDDQ